MKTQTNPAQNQNLPRSIDRWRWMVGATAASAAATASQAAIVQISLVHNQINSQSGNSLDADLTGSSPTVQFSKSHFHSTPAHMTMDSAAAEGADATVYVNAVWKAIARAQNSLEPVVYSNLDVYTGNKMYMPFSGLSDALIPVTFQDPKFNAGAATTAFLDVAASRSVISGGYATAVAMMRLVFDDADPTSTLTGVVAGGTNTVIGTTVKGFFARIKNDFNGDGYPDLLWQNVSNGNLAVWLMSGTAILSEQTIASEPNTAWQIVGTGVFNDSGYNDLLWQNNSTGQVMVWFMNATTHLSSQVIATVPDLHWKIVGTGDFNGDGKPDILWQNTSTGAVEIWLMNGTNGLSTAIIGNENTADWKIVGTGDFNGDGNTDILWQNPVNGKVVVWFMNGTSFVSSQLIATQPNTDWKIAGVGDFNGDGKPDILWQNDSNGQLGVWFMNGTSILSEKIIATEANTNWQIRNK